MDETTKSIIKYVGVLISLPWVIPFVRALIKDLYGAFEEDGGFLGSPPSPDALREIQERKASEPDLLVNEVLAHLREKKGNGGKDSQ